MNILFLTLSSFSSLGEKGIYTDLLREFSKNNHKLYIVTPIEKRKNESTNVVKEQNTKILRLQIGNIQKTGLIEKGISTLMLETQFKKGIKKHFNDVKFDLVLYSTPPITLQKAVEFVKRRDGAKTYLLLKDIFPQNAVDLSMLQTSGVKSLVYKYFKLKEDRLYKISDYIGCMSKANVEFLLRQSPSVSDKAIEVCPNSIEPIEINILADEKKRIRVRYNIPIDKTVFIYGGNLGKPQGIDFLIECIKANEENLNSFILIVGSGTEFIKLQNFFNTENTKNAILLSQLPKKDYEILASSCDVGLIFLDKRFTIPNFPSRLLSYMQAAMPVLAATDINTDVGKVIEQGDFGFWCESNDAIIFNKKVQLLCNVELRKQMGANARKYLEEHYTSKHSYEIIMKHFEEVK